MAKVSDLKDQTGTNDNSILHCECCGDDYSANKGDYFLYPADHVFTCCGEEMILATRVVSYVRGCSIPFSHLEETH